VTGPGAQATASDPIEQGEAALRRGAWAEARDAFVASLAREETPRAYEGLGIATRYLWDLPGAFAAHEQGYRLARSLGDNESAARLATQLALDAYGQGRVAEANGWCERALVLTEESGPSHARALAYALRAHIAMLVHNDPAQTRELSGQALELARAAASSDVETTARALQGLALVCDGEVEEGMRRLDAATAAAVAGDVTDVDMAETICCYLIDACKRVRDLERASEWCLRVQELATKYDDRFMFTVCRVHHADVLVWRGAWPEAEHELRQAIDALQELGSDRTRDSVVRLAELRRREGRLEEAAAFLAECEGHRLHPLHDGLVALDQGDHPRALEGALQFLRRVGDGDRFQRIAGLELLVRASIATGDIEQADEAASELRATADSIGTQPLRAAALLAEGRIAAARGHETMARPLLDDAADAFERSGAPYEAAQTRLELAAVLRSLGNGAAARAAEDRASRALLDLGIAGPAKRREAPGLLSRREQEVLRLLARGRSNDEIATALVLSVRTVERHVANVYAKVGVSGRTARAAATAWAHAHDIGSNDIG
jgi:LuxR family transcriptional regulator, maltose regulon positive regulatory protein